MAQTSEVVFLPTSEVQALCPETNLERLIPESCSEYLPMNDISQQTKDQVHEYITSDWVTTKLSQIKSGSSLQVHSFLLPNSIRVNGNIISADVTTYLDKIGRMQFHFFEDGIVKLNCINPANPSKFSFELLEKPANLTPYPVTGKVNTTEKTIEVSMPEVQAKFVAEFDPFTVKIISTRTENEEVLLEMNASKSLVFDENLTADFTFHSEYLYGLPEHATDLLLQDTKKDLPYRFYNQDVPKFPVGSKNGLYATVPIIVSRTRNSPTLVSMYWQNTSDTYIEVHKTKNAFTKAFWLSERGNLECYFFVSHSNEAHYKSMANVFGHCAMPQYFSLGYHQCRWSYLDQEDLLHVNEKFNEHEIPCDTLTLDIDHTDGCRYFTWNHKLFPDPVGMQEALARDGRQLVTIADPHIKVDEDYHIYKEAAERNLLVKTKDGDQFVGKCWPGDSVYLDFLNEETRQHWASQYRYDKYLGSTPNVWAWNDMNEPSVFEHAGNAMPIDNIQTFRTLAEPEKAFEVEHREVHNIYGYGQHKATYEGMVNRNENKNIRPHVLSRSFYAGSQKWTTIWTGDTGASWDYLQNTVPQLLSLSLCGISNAGGDVGGFLGDPEPELAIRWYQVGMFMPYFRAHSEITSKRREPWLYEKKYCDIIKECIKERYRLLPYWYSTFADHCKTAIPVLRPIWFDQPQIPKAENMKEQQRFMVGNGILAVPILNPGETSIKKVFAGLEGRWYDYYSKKEMVGENEEIKTGLERIGCFVKGGNIIPTLDIRTYVQSSKDAKESNLVFYVALDENDSAKGSMYFDDGETFDYKKGAFCKKNITFENNVLSWTTEGKSDYAPHNRVTKLLMMGLKSKVQNAYLVEEGKAKQKVQLVKNAGYLAIEFVAVARRDWKVILE